MGDTRIVNGADGAKYAVKVDSDNRLSVAANVQNEEHFISSSQGLAFSVNSADTADTLTTTATGGCLLYAKNGHATKQLVVSGYRISSDTAGITSSITTEPTLGTIGNNNVHSPVNLNANSNNEAQGTFYNWNEVGDGMTGLSGGNKLETNILNVGVNDLTFEDSLILEPNASLCINVYGVAEVSVSLRCFYMDKEA